MVDENNPIVKMDLAEVERRLAGDMTPEQLRSLQKLYWPLAYSTPLKLSGLAARRKTPETTMRRFRESYPGLKDFYKKIAFETGNRDA